MTRWQIDSAHSAAEFSVKHLMITNVRGRFGSLSGTVEYTPGQLAEAKVEATLDASSIDTREARRDGHLRSADFFDVEKYPTLTFRSLAVTPKGDDAADVRGELTIRGITREVTLHVEGLSDVSRDPWGNSRIGLSAKTKLHRKDFGLTWNQALEAGGVLVGDEVKIELDISLVAAADKPAA